MFIPAVANAEPGYCGGGLEDIQGSVCVRLRGFSEDERNDQVGYKDKIVPDSEFLVVG